MNSSVIVAAFENLCKSNTDCGTDKVVQTILRTKETHPEIVTIKKNSILYLSRDKRWGGNDDIVCIALSMDYFLYTEDPRPKVVPKRIVNVEKYKDVGEHRFYANRVYNKVVLDRDIRLIDIRKNMTDECTLIRNSLLNVDGVIVRKSENPNLISLQVDDILSICTLVKRMRPTSKNVYDEVKTKEYSGNDAHILDSMIIERQTLY